MTRERPEDAAILAELERFRLAIEFGRARRDETGEDFEAFVRARMPAAREPAGAGPSHPQPAVSPAPATAGPAPPAAASAAVGQPVAPSSPSIFFETTAADLVGAELEAEEPPRSRRGWLAGAAVLLLLAGAAAFWMLRSAEPDRPAVETTAAVPAPSAAPAAPAAAPAPAPAPPPAPPSPVLTTTRAVWLRVLADGARVLEREVPAGTRIPLRAASTIVIRTGDGGAVQISLAGEEPAALGRDGQVVTRTFTLPAR